LSHTKVERTPAQIAKSFRLTRGAITNTLNKLELSGYVHVRPDWEDARRKMVSISPAGIAARNNALIAVTPIINELAHEMGEERLKAIVPILRELRQKLE
jgi:DNA-binding MarR family transcriptional regulator